MLADGGVSAISYAERLYQLPVGVIGIAAAGGCTHVGLGDR